MAVPPFIIHFSRIVHKINPPAIGVFPHDYGKPHMIVWESHSIDRGLEKKGLTNKLGRNQRCKKWDLSS
jgi:hypothetical protein